MHRRYTFQILAPKLLHPPASFASYTANQPLHRARLDALQRLRGRLYRMDGAIDENSLDPDGRFRMQGDEDAWHLLVTIGAEDVIGCARYLVHPEAVPYRSLRLSSSPLARHPAWSAKLRAAVQADLQLARQRQLLYVEIGGWALAEEHRKTNLALEMAAASYALGHLWGGIIGSCTATLRHRSASMLRRLGGSSFVAHGTPLPTYFDPRFRCQMELLRFDYLTPSPRLHPLIETIKSRLATTEIVTSHLEPTHSIPGPGTLNAGGAVTTARI